MTKQDIQNNFFLDPESTGQSKSKSAAELLQELNEDASVVHEEKVKKMAIERVTVRSILKGYSIRILLN